MEKIAVEKQSELQKEELLSEWKLQADVKEWIFSIYDQGEQN